MVENKAIIYFLEGASANEQNFLALLSVSVVEIVSANKHFAFLNFLIHFMSK